MKPTIFKRIENSAKPLLRSLACLSLLVTGNIYSQTMPAAHSVIFSENFSSLSHSSTTYPSSFQGWKIGSASGSTFKTAAPSADESLKTNSSASTTAGGIHNYNGKIGMLASGSSDPSLALALNTSGYQNISITFDVMTIRNPYDSASNTRINNLELQYRVSDSSGTFTSLSGSIYSNNTIKQTGSGVVTPQNLQTITINLPSACNNQPYVQLRWVQRDSTGGGLRPSFALDNICIGASEANITDYVFTENIGTVGSTTSIAAHETNNGFENIGYTMSGNADIRATQSSNGNYAGASGGANVFFTSTSQVYFQIEGINTIGEHNLKLNFGLYKSSIASNGSTFKVEISADGTNYSQLVLDTLPTGSGTSVWHLVTASGIIPQASNLRIRFSQTDSVSSYRLDDIKLSSHNNSAFITSSGGTSFCEGSSIELSTIEADSYLWNTEETTQSIVVTEAGNYTVSITYGAGCTLISDSIAVTTYDLPVADAGADKIIMLGESVQIGSDPIAGYTYSWTPTTGLSNPNIANPLASPAENTEYILTIIGGVECAFSDTLKDSVLVNVEVWLDGEFPSHTALEGNNPITGEPHIHAYDRFGNSYNLWDITQGSCTPGWTTTSQVSAGFFNLLFCTQGSFTNPFTQPVIDVISQVFEDVSELIVPQNCGGNPAEVNIQITATSTGIGGFALGTASQFYIPAWEVADIANETEGILYGQVWRAINTGVNHPTLIDAQIELDFVNFNFNTNYPSPSQPGQHDLYSVVLHELLHCLGFASLVGSNGLSRFSQYGLDFYSGYDKYLKGNNVNTIDWGLGNLYAPSYNTNSPLSGCSMSFDGLYSNNTDIANWNEGQHSHFSHNCNPGTNRVMLSSISTGVDRRQLSDDDVNALLDLGYEITGTFPPNSPSTTPTGGAGIIGVNDGFNSYNNNCAARFLMELCPSPDDYIEITTAQLIANDINADDIIGLELIGNTGTLVNTGVGTWDFYPTQLGFFGLRYTPVSNNLSSINVNTIGNPTHILIEVISCNTLGTCYQPDVCNLTCNPSLEYPGNSGCSTFYHDPCDVPNWQVATGTPDLFPWSFLNTPSPPFFFRMNASTYGTGAPPPIYPKMTESLLTNVEVFSGNKYTFSYWRRTDVDNSVNWMKPFDHIYIRLTNDADLSSVGLPTFAPIFPNTLPANQLILEERLVYSDVWERVTICFEADDDYDRLWIYAEMDDWIYPGTDPLITEHGGWLFIDEIYLVEDTYSAGDNQNIACGSITLGSQSCELDGAEYFWNKLNDPTEIGNEQQITVNINENTTFEVNRTYPANPNTIYIPTTADNCGLTDEISVTLTAPLGFSISEISPSCLGSCDGSAFINNITNGTSPYFYSWEDENQQVISILDNANNLCEGNYLVTVTDANNCTATANATINEPDEIILTPQIAQSICLGLSNGTIDLNVSGGTAPYSYQWSGPSSFTATTQNLSNLATVGNYSVIVTDDNNCTETTNINISQSPTINLSTQISHVSCFGEDDGAIDLNVTGGVPGYTYLWTPGGATTQNINSLPTDNYQVTVTDANNCTAIANPTVNEPDELNLSLQISQAICQQNDLGAIDVTVTGGTSPYTFQWTGPNSFGATTQNIDDLEAGTYTITVTDDNGCQLIDNITIATPLAPTANFSAPISACYEGDGANIPFTNLSTPDLLSFHWDFGDGEDSQQEDPTHIYDEPGTYLVTLTATDLCNQTDIYSQTIQIIPSYTAGGYNSNCCSENTSLVTYDITDYTVSGNETWTSTSNPANNSASFYVKGTITVPAGNSLMIEDGLEIFFGPLGKIIVEQEAFLFVTDNTVLDGLPQCSTLWQGIEVWGHADQVQLYATSSGSIITITIPQGVVVIGDGSQVNHAHNAVLVGKPGVSTAFEASHGGGLLFVNEANFNDNATSIKFSPYNNYIYSGFGMPVDNFSFVQNSTFQCSGQITDPGYNSNSTAGYTYPNAGTRHYSPANNQGFSPMHIMVNNTGKVNIRENNFSGNAIEGIEAFNAAVFAEQNTFENMDYGFVGLTNLGSIFKAYELETNDFNDINIAGVMKIGQGVINMKENVFENPSFNNQMDYLLGTYLYGTFYFGILDNIYNRPAYGLGLVNSGWFGGNIYATNNNIDVGNRFTHTAFGSFTFANNPSAKISCNTYDNSAPTDYLSNWINIGGSLATQGSGCHSSTSPAGNKFDPSPDVQNNRLKHIYNTTNTPYTYHHHNDWPAGCADCVVPEAMGNVLLNNCQINYVSESSCEICESCKTQAYIDNARDEMEDLETELKTLMDGGLDGGSTESLLGEILEGGYNHYELNDILTNASPLSEIIMEILIEEADTLIGDIFKDLIITNSPVSDSLWYYALEPRLKNIAPEPAEEIRVNQFNPTSTKRTPALIKREIEAIRIDRQSVLNSMLMDSLQNFSLKLNLDSLSLSAFANISVDTFGLSAANWVYQTLLNEPNTDPVFAGMYALDGNADSAEARINKLPNISEEEQSLVSYFNMMKSLAADSLTPMESSESQKNQLRAMKEYEEIHPVSSLASATLWLLGEKTDPLLPYLPSSKNLDIPDNSKREKEENTKKQAYNNKSWLGQNVPNPFGEYTQIPYFVAEKNVDANIRIYDIGGREMYVHKAKPGYNRHKLDVQTWSKGIYIYCLEINQQIIGYEKMVIIK